MPERKAGKLAKKRGAANIRRQNQPTVAAADLHG
jgi:hypothetical protein